ncbi:MAG: DUF1573 domain-containing protein [Candidatus Omnitrophica bacterium]|nr:DUF1573 domain-containing protein [Candidatus Omnitrophota bacterium]MBU1869934.1 DUF1573 domain-containing protein [Candidatus Omnitrophota bacterium]
MCRRLFVFFLLFLSFISFGFASGGPVAPEHSNGDYSLDLGSAKEGQFLKHEFKLKNLSKKTLELKRISTSCGCTVSKANKRKLAPNEEALINIEFNTKGYSGIVEQRVFIYIGNESIPAKISIDAEKLLVEKPVIRIKIKAEVSK